MNDAEAMWLVIGNCEDEFAVWSSSKPIPASWREVGVRGTRADCAAYIRNIDDEPRAAALRKYLESVTIRP